MYIAASLDLKTPRFRAFRPLSVFVVTLDNENIARAPCTAFSTAFFLMKWRGEIFSANITVISEVISRIAMVFAALES